MQEINPTRKAILDLAEDMLQRQSFANVSFQTLAKGVGIKKGSMYYHFETKEELGEAILDRTIAILKSSFKDLEKEPIVKQLHVYTNWFLKHIGAAERVCQGLNFAASWDAVPSPLKDRVKKLYIEHEKGLAKIIRTGQELGEFPLDEKSPEEIAHLAFCMLQGGLISARVIGDETQFLTCKKQVLEMIKGN